MPYYDLAFIAGVAIDSNRSAHLVAIKGEHTMILFIEKINGGLYRTGDATAEDDVKYNTYKSITYVTHPAPATIAITDEGFVRVINDTGTGHNESIPRSSVLCGVASISGKAFAFGANREIWRRDHENEWVRVPPPPGNSKNDMYLSMNGFDENDFYVGSSGGELWHYKHGNWTQQQIRTGQIIITICCAPDGKVYACGQSALIIIYENGQGQLIQHKDENHPRLNLNEAYGDIWSTAWFRGKLYVSGYKGVFTLEGHELIPVDFGDQGPDTTYKLSVTNDCLISIGAIDIVQLHEEHWVHLFKIE